jgi:chromosome segregation ATPase
VEDKTAIVSFIIALLTGGGIGAALVNAWANRPKIKADASGALVDRTLAYSDDLSEQVERVLVRLGKAETALTLVQDDNFKLRTEVHTMRTDLEDRDRYIDSLVAERDKFRERSDNLALIEADQQLQISSQSRRIEALEAEVARLRERIAQMEGGGGTILNGAAPHA